MQKTQPQSPLGQMWNSIQSWLFPVLEDEIGALDEKQRQFVAVCELCNPHDHMATYRWIGNGCPPSDRLALCKACTAKAVWDFATACDWNGKTNNQGKRERRGYKAHLAFGLLVIAAEQMLKMLG